MMPTIKQGTEKTTSEMERRGVARKNRKSGRPHDMCDEHDFFCASPCSSVSFLIFFLFFFLSFQDIQKRGFILYSLVSLRLLCFFFVLFQEFSGVL